MSALFLLLTLVGLLYDWLTLPLLKKWLSTPPPPDLPTPPVTFFRTIKPGVPDLEKKLADFLHCVHSQDQILFGFNFDDSSTARSLEQVAGNHSHPGLQLIPCHPNFANNPKINKLLQLTALATHDHWILLDSELENASSFLPQFRREWSLLHHPVFSAPYRFRQFTLDTAPCLLTLVPGLALLRSRQQITLTLGAAVALTRSHLDTLGGWRILSDYLAEDFQLGQRLAQKKIPIALSASIAQLDNDALTPSQLFQKLHRSASTIRVSQPWGFAGSLLIQSPFWALLFLLATPLPGSLLPLVFALTSRTLVSQHRAKLLAWPLPPGRLPLLVASALIEPFFWFLAWLPLKIHWAGKKWHLTSDGRLL